MNANAIAKNYSRLTPEERFHLILAASGRGDEAERDRLLHARRRITLSMTDHSPYAHAFDELALLTFIELLEEAARYLEFFERADVFGDDDDEEEESPDEKADAEPAEDDARDRRAWQRSLDLALAAGYVLRAKADGWKRFCEQLYVPPFLLWEGLPGFDRLQCALTLAEKAAFIPEEMLGWMNAIRPAGEPELTEVPLTTAGLAAAAEEAFRQRVHWWGG